MLRVLLVEDDPDVAFVISTLLEMGGYHVTVASNGSQGMDIALQERPEMIVTDFMMPVLSGLQMIEQLREAGYTAPIILCSAIPEQRFPTHHAKYDAFLLKPYRADQLIAAIESVRSKG